MEENNNTYRGTVDIIQLFLMLWKKKGAIILVGVIFAVLLGGLKTFTYNSETMYSATSRVYVEADFSKINMDEVLQNFDNLILNEGAMTSEYYKNILSSALKEDYKVIVTSNTVIQEVINNLNLDLDYNELFARITVTSVGTSIVEIKVKDKNEQLAKEIVDSLAEVSSKRIVDIMDVEKVEIVDKGFVIGDITPEQRLQLAEGKSIEEVLPAQALSKGTLLKYAILGGILGSFLAVVVVLFFYMIDKTIKDEKDIECYLGLPVIGTVPAIKGTKKAIKKAKK